MPIYKVLRPFIRFSSVQEVGKLVEMTEHEAAGLESSCLELQGAPEAKEPEQAPAAPAPAPEEEQEAAGGTAAAAPAETPEPPAAPSGEEEKES